MSPFEDERHVVEDGLENDAVNPDNRVGNVGVFVNEYVKREKDVFGKSGFIKNNETETENSNDYENESMPAVSDIHNTASSDGYRNGRRRSEDDDRADIVDFEKSLFQRQFQLSSFRKTIMPAKPIVTIDKLRQKIQRQAFNSARASPTSGPVPLSMAQTILMSAK